MSGLILGWFVVRSVVTLMICGQWFMNGELVVNDEGLLINDGKWWMVIDE